MISILIPVCNEEDSLPVLYDELIRTLPGLKEEYELLFIDDGSTDNSLEILKKLHNKNKHVRVFSFRRNRGKADALSYGFAVAKGEIVITMDADLQDRPSEITKFLAKYKEGAEVVCGWRKERRDKPRMLIISRFFNYLVSVFFDLNIHDIDCGFKLFTREAAKSLHIYGGLYRFIPLLLYQQGFTVSEVIVEHDTRKFGKSKYGFSKVWKNLPDLFTMFFLIKYRNRPLHFFGIIGGLVFLIGIIILLYLTYIHTFLGQPIYRRPILFGGVLFVVSGLQIFFTGFLADLMINISHEPKMLDVANEHFSLKYSSDK